MQGAMRSWRCPGVGCTRPIRRCRWSACYRRFFSGTGWDGQRDIDARSSQSVPVLIVGAGPVGLTLLILLSKLGQYYPVALCSVGVVSWSSHTFNCRNPVLAGGKKLQIVTAPSGSCDQQSYYGGAYWPVVQLHQFELLVDTWANL